MSFDSSVPALRDRAAAQLRHGDPTGAVETLRRALSAEPDDASSHALLALALVQARRRHAARAEAAVALTLQPEAPFPHLAMGVVLRAHGELRAAERELRQSVELAPSWPEGHRSLAEVLRARGKAAEARAALDLALGLDPGDPQTLSDLAELELAAGRLDEAERWARLALARDPQCEDALVALGGVLLRRGRVEEARELAVAALQQDATSSSGIRLLAQVKARQSWALGLWWRWGALLERFGPGRQILILMLLFVAYRFAVLALQDLGLPTWARAAQWVWLAFAAYTWFGPALFRRSLLKELERVQLSRDF